MTAAAPSDSSDPSSPHGRFLPGALLGDRYRIVGLLGRGGMGEVYRADDLELGQSVALKFVPEHLAADTTAWQRLRNEVRTARQLAHPNICRVYDIAKADGQVFFTMEYVDGDDLSHVLRRLGPPARDKAVEIGRQLCAGLAAAHENGILHRDLKPANVMIDGRGRVRITDFGLAGLAQELAENPQRAGTPAYMAPEQHRSGSVSKRSDIYSLGLVLYELFTGKRPFDGTTARATSSAPSMQSHNETVDPAVERIVLRCLESDPAERPASVYEVMAALPGGDPLAAALAAGETPSPEMIVDAQARGGLSPRPALIMLGATLVSIGILATVGSRWTRMPEKNTEELAAIAREIVRELGHDLPEQQASQVINIDIYQRPVGNSPRVPYVYWHRASLGSLQSQFLHNPLTRPGDPPNRPPGSVDILLDTAGRLLELDIVPMPHDPGGEERSGATDWTPLLERAGLDPAEAERVRPVAVVPAYCGEVAAFQGAGYVFQAAAHRNRVVHAVTVFDQAAVSPLTFLRNDEPVFTGGKRESGALTWIVFASTLLPVFFAWNHVRRGRVDRRGAVVFGAVIFFAYLLYDAVHAPTAYGLKTAFFWIVNINPAAHASLHGLHAALLYVAIEPYVRRVWPKALIGWARLARGRWNDPVVGREVLCGVTSIFAVLSVGILVRGAVRVSAGLPLEGVQPNADRMRDASTMLFELPHMLAVSMLFTLTVCFVLLIARWVTRRDWIAVLATTALLHVGFTFLAGFRPADDFASAVTLIPILTGSLACAWLAVRVGLIASSLACFTLVLVPSIPMTFDVSKSYAPAGMVGIVAFALLAAFGFRYSLGGKIGDLLG